MSTPATQSDMLERTLAVLCGPEQVELRTEVEQRITRAGFRIVAAAHTVAEELEEAGLDVDNILERGESVPHVALVLERESAVSGWRELIGHGRAALNRDSLAATFPTLKLFGSPSAAAASMSIMTLFPHIDLPVAPAITRSIPHQQPTNDASPPLRANAPFALSNLAHPSPPSAKSGELSPAMARALQNVEDREDEQERRRTSAGFDERAADTDVDADAPRTFTYHSRDTTMEFGSQTGEEDSQSQASFDDEYADDDELAALEAEQEVLDTLDEDEIIALSQAQVIENEVVLPPATSNRVASLAQPSIQPRLTKAARLRLGIPNPPRTPHMREPSSASTNDSTASATSTGDLTPRVRSLNAPAIMPRGTKTSNRRTNVDDEPVTAVKIRREAVGTAERSADPLYDDTPGHKRRHSIQVASTAQPAIMPRLTKAAMLRAGMEIPKSLPRQRNASADDEETPSKKPVVAPVRSTAPPAIVPRGTKSSALRAGVDQSTPMQRIKSATNTLPDVAEEPQRRESVLAARRPTIEVRMTKTAALRTGVDMPALRHKTSATSSVSENSATSASNPYEGVAGHKRRESIQVASTARPLVEPRLTRKEMLLRGMDVPLTPAERRASTVPTPTTFEGVPGHRRRESIATVASSRPPTITPRLNKSSILRQGPASGREPISPAFSRPPAITAAPLSRTSSTLSASAPKAPAKQPTIAPRTNKSAELRAAKKEADDLALLKKGKPAYGPKRPSTSQGVLRTAN